MNYLEILSSLYALNGLNYVVYDKNFNVIFSYPESSTIDTMWNQFILDKLKDIKKRIDRIQLSSLIYQYVIRCKDVYISIGPVSHQTLTSFELYRFQKENHLSKIEIINCSRNTINSTLSILNGIFHEQIISMDDISQMFEEENMDKKKMPFITEIQQHNHTYATEKYFFNLVKSGNIEEVQNYIKHHIFLHPSPLSNDLKDKEYMLVSLVSLLCRNAIEANVPANISLSHSDSLLKEISECKSIEEFQRVSKYAILSYTDLVHQYQLIETYSLLSRKCQKYIQSNIFQEISLQSIAKELNVSKEHLSTCFKNDFNMTVTQYIHTKKIEISKEMLANTEYSINEISNYLCFHSTSYFIGIFKKYVGCTPNQYRKEHFL